MRQENPDFELDYHYDEKTGQVRVSLRVGAFPTITIYLTPDKFVILMDAVVKTTQGFIKNLSEILGRGKDKDIKAGFSAEAWDRMMKLKEQYEQKDK